MLGAMSRWGCVTAVVCGLLIAGCGGSSSTSSSSSSTARQTITASATVTPPPSTTSATTTSAPSAPPEVPRSRRHHARPGPSVSSGATLPASFVILSGGRLSPPTISAPSGAKIYLAVTDHDQIAHTVRLVSVGGPTLRVAAGRSGEVGVSGLRNGHYRVLVDGRAEGTLVVGAQGGP